VGGLTGLEAGPGGDTYGVHPASALLPVEALAIERAGKALFHEVGDDDFGIGDEVEFGSGGGAFMVRLGKVKFGRVCRVVQAVASASNASA